MGDIEKLHMVEMEWGCVAKLLDRISDVESTIEGGWNELLSVAADAMDDGANGKDTEKIFFEIYAFLFRLWFRVKVNPMKQSFNIYRKRTEGGDTVYLVENYDYAMFRWAREHGFDEGIDNKVIRIPASKLTGPQCKAIEKKIHP